MKKQWYYVTPVVVFPITRILLSFLADMEIIINLNFTIIAPVFFLISIIIGNLTPTSRMFDYAIPAVSVAAYAWYCFFRGLFDEPDYDCNTRFNIVEAYEWVFSDTTLILYVIIAVTTFLASFKLIRITRIIKNRFPLKMHGEAEGGSPS